MENIFSSRDQILLFLLFFSLAILLFAILTDKLNGLFLARNPLDTKSYEPSSENENERRAGLLFAKLVYKSVSVIIPLCLLLYNNMVVKFLGVVVVIAVLIYRGYQKR